MNETLRRAMLRARLSEEDVAARLQVDPKTVRRWLEGRVPYLRHRWALAGLLDADEADLWPEVRAAIAARSRPAEIKAVYPNRQAMPRQAWQSLFRSAEHEIGILARNGLFLAREPGVLDVLADRARAGARVRICLPNPNTHVRTENGTGEDPGDASARARSARLSPCSGDYARSARRSGCTGPCFTTPSTAPTTRSWSPSTSTASPANASLSSTCRSATAGDMAAVYLDVFERIWATSLPAA